MNSKIAIIIPYYGQWPEWHGLYLNSCKFNPCLNIIYITDLTLPKDAPSNVSVVKLTFNELIDKISNSLNIELPHIQPYKLCDIRPAYGYIFKELLSGYTHWGYGDNDLVYGNISKFLTEEVLNNHDIFAFRSDILHGPFTIYKNSAKCCELFLKSPEWKTILMNEMYSSFDEFGKLGFHTLNEVNIFELPCDNISVIALQDAKNGNLNLYMNPISKEVICDSNDILLVKNGKVLNARNQEEYAFYHWVFEKRALWFQYPHWDIVPDAYYVSDSGFYSSREYRYYSILSTYRKTLGFVLWGYLKITNYLKRLLGIKVKLDTYPRIGFVKKIV